MQRLGAVPLEGGVEFRVWAPAAASTGVRVRGTDHARELDVHARGNTVTLCRGDTSLVLDFDAVTVELRQ